LFLVKSIDKMKKYIRNFLNGSCLIFFHTLSYKFIKVKQINEKDERNFYFNKKNSTVSKNLIIQKIIKKNI
jgi:hypothetical protein